MSIFTADTPENKAARTSLAITGFVALVAAGVWLAAYATRFVPAAVNGIGEAAVYVGSIFANNSEKTEILEPSKNTATSDVPVNEIAKRPTPVRGQETNIVLPISGSTTTPAYTGLPDLTVRIDAIGYLNGTSADTFVASSTVPSGRRPAVRFTIENVGTNVTSVWRWSASLPTQTAYAYQSQAQQPLAPGDRIEYTLGFDRANRGDRQTISIIVNPDNIVAESNTNNNRISAQITILGM